MVSGDGLMGAIGGAMAGAETPVGLIPGGRGNDLARALGIPNDPEAAVEVILAGHSRRIDVGEANGKRFLGIVSVGFDSECNRLANETHFIRGNLVYAYSMVRTLIGWRSARFTVVADGERKRLEGYFVDVANNCVYRRRHVHRARSRDRRRRSSTSSRSPRSASCGSCAGCERWSRAPTSTRRRSPPSAPRASSSTPAARSRSTPTAST